MADVSVIEDSIQPALDDAARDVEKLRSLGISDEKICQTLSQRHPRETVQRLFPHITLPGPLPAKLTPFAELRVESSSPKPHAFPLRRPDRHEEHQERVAPAAGLSDELAFQYVPLIQCTFPHSEQLSVSTYTRRNGRLELTIATSVAGVGLPYGVPARLLAIYAATEVVRTRSREIFLGRTITEFLRRLDVTVTSGRRGTIASYLDQLRRLIHAVFTIEEDIADGAGRVGIRMRKVLFAEEARLWNDDRGTGVGSSIILSEQLFESMLERSAPLSMDAIRALRRSPMDLDLYAWLVYRLFQLNRTLVIPWPDLGLQFGQSYTRERDFRVFFHASLKRVARVYPEAKVAVVPEGLKLLPSRAHIARKR